MPGILIESGPLTDKALAAELLKIMAEFSAQKMTADQLTHLYPVCLRMVRNPNGLP